MALHFVFGGSGIDKSGWLCEKITKEAAKNRDRRYLILVPEQFTLENQRKYVERSPGKCILNIDILSLLRLSVRVFEETGAAREVIDDLGKTLIVRKVMEEQRDSLGFLKKGLTKPGVLDEIKSFLSELMQYDIGTAQIEDMLSVCERENKTVLYNKLKDMKLIYEKFQEKTEDKYLTTEGMYDILERILEAAGSNAEQLKWLKGSTICLDGYTGFTPVQYKVIRQLLLIAGDVYLLVDIDRQGYADKESRLFSLAHETIGKMTEIARQAGVELARPEWPQNSRIMSAELLHLERTLLRYPAAVYGEGKDKTEDIRVIRTVNTEQELRFAVSHIKELVREGEYRYGDIAVVTGDMEGYGMKLKNMLEAENIPCFLDWKRNIMGHPFTEYLRSFLKLFSGNFADDDVIAFIKNPYFIDISEASKDILENYIRKAGIRGKSQWEKPFKRKLKDNEGEPMNALRERFWEKLSPFLGEMAKKNSILSYTKCLYDFISGEECFYKIENERAKAENEGDILRAAGYGQIYGIVLNIMDKLVEVLGDEKVSLREYTELLEVGLSGGEIGLIPPQMNVVLIGDLKRTRISGVRAMFLLGVNDGIIPAPEDGGGILTEFEREFIQEESERGKKTYFLAPSRSYNTMIAQYYLYLNLTKPSNKLYLSYSEVNAKGEKRNPSYIIGKLRLIFPTLFEADWETYKKTGSYDILADRGRELLLSGIRENSWKNEEASDFYSLFYWYKNSGWEWLERLILTTGRTGLPGKIEEEAAKLLYGKELHVSVTRFEKYASCALGHFLSYGLGLKERELFKVQAPDFGSLFHEVMKEFFENAAPEKIFVENDGFDLTAGQEEELNKALKKVISASSQMNEALWEKERSQYIFRRLERMCRRTIWAVCIQLQRGEFNIKNSELPFNSKKGRNPSREELSDKVKMEIGGIIDRLDVYETDDKLFYRIVDYKTGANKLRLDEVYYGLRQQLFIYMEAAEKYLYGLMKAKKEDKEIVPAGAYYYNVSDPVVDEADVAQGGVADNGVIRDKILAGLKMEGYTNKEEPVPEYTDRSLKKPQENPSEKKAPDLSRGSDIVQMKYKKDGEVDAYSKAIDTEFFNLLKKHVIKKVKSQAEEMYEGNTKAAPTAVEGEDACRYCPYGEICILTNKDERQLKPLSKDEVGRLIFEDKEERP